MQPNLNESVKTLKINKEIYENDNKELGDEGFKNPNVENIGLADDTEERFTKINDMYDVETGEEDGNNINNNNINNNNNNSENNDNINNVKPTPVVRTESQINQIYQSAKNKYEFKVILVGDSKSGKTSLVNRIMTNTFTETPPKLGEVNKKKVVIDANTVATLCIWDSIVDASPQFYRDAHCALIVMDLSNRDTLNSIQKWYSNIDGTAPRDCETIIVGTKLDLVNLREVTKSDLESTAQRLGVDEVIEVSSSEGLNVGFLVQKISERIISRQKVEKEKGDPVPRKEERMSIGLKDVKTKKKFCCL